MAKTQLFSFGCGSLPRARKGERPAPPSRLSIYLELIASRTDKGHRCLFSSSRDGTITAAQVVPPRNSRPLA